MIATCNFRKNIVGLTADIGKAFLMVGIQDDQRDFLRFLWFDDPSLENPKIIHLKFTRLVFGLRPSPAILGATIQHHLKLYKQSDPEMFKLLEQSFYVDDLLTGESNDEKALAIYHRAKKLMAEGGFNLRKWKTNSLEREHANRRRHLREGFRNELEYSRRRNYLQLCGIVQVCKLTSAHQEIGSQSDSKDI